MTGLSENQRNDFNLMKELDNVIKPSAHQKLNKCREMIDMINTN